MKLKKGFWARMVPVILLVALTLVLSIIVYNRMMTSERDTCWQRLKIATESTAGKIQVRITDNLNFLDAVSDSYILTHHLEYEKDVGNYLNSVMEKTIFERISVVLPDGIMLTQSGERIHAEGELNYDALVAKGTHISPRISDPFINKDVIYCFTPVENDGEVIALLCGTINCETLHQYFEVFTYRNQNSQMFLIDCSDGNYLIDNWHDELGNVYDNQWREGMDGEMVDIATPVLNRETGGVAFVSNSNGEISYQYYAPVDGFNWGLCVVVQEDVAFANLNKLESLLYKIGAVEALLLFAYIGWNIYITINATRNEEKAHELELNKATNEAKARFISNMSHDIRTPINGIVGMLYIIKNHRNEEAVVDDCLQKIEISTQYLSTLTADMLDINEIESNKLVLENVPIDLKAMANALNVILEPKAVDAGVRYHMDCSSLKNPYVMGSEVHIERVMVNLISNAIKYSKPQDAEVWVSIEEGEVKDGNGVYRFVVKDNGIGMSEEFQKDMYNAFAQELVTARSSYQGYGLGLTIVYRLVEKMGGTIHLESEKDKGSTFTVTLPLKLDTAESHTQQNEQPVTDLNGVKILLVEDNEFNSEIAEVILSDVGASVTTAENGRIATEMFAAAEPFAFDLILMDIMMPEMDGYEATQAIRAMDREDAESVPIFAMTASAFAEEVIRCKEAGMNEHIAKPLDINKLMHCVAKYCK